MKSWASILKHKISSKLIDIFFEFTGDNQINVAREKFKHLQIVEPNLKGFFIRDKVSPTSSEQVPPELSVHYWPRKEIENYLIIPSVLERFVKKQDSFGELFVEGRIVRAKQYLEDNLPPKVYKNPINNDIDGKGSDFLEKFFKEVGIKINKGEYWKIADIMEESEIHEDIKKILDDLQKAMEN